jgi:hypothetical protein
MLKGSLSGEAETLELANSSCASDMQAAHLN